MSRRSKILISAIIIIILIFGLYAYSQGTFTPTEGMLYNGKEVVFALNPLFGYYACEITEYDVEQSIVTSIDGSTKTVTFTCPPNNWAVTKCEIWVRDRGSTWYLPGTSGRWYNCATGGCPDPNTEEGYPIMVDRGNEEKITSINPGQTILVVIRAAETGTLLSIQDVYGLYRYEKGAKDFISGGYCDIPNYVDQCIDCQAVFEKYDLETDGDGKPNRLEPNEFSNFLDTWFVTPEETGGIYNYEGKDAFCIRSKIYEINTVKLETGNYVIPGDIVDSVQCCPGDKNGDQECGYDFKWGSVGVGCCASGICTIQACDGEGDWITDYSITNKIKRATACTTEGECLYEYKTVECSRNFDCDTGQICNKNTWTCEGGTEPCGDKNGDCWDDCSGTYIPGCTVDPSCTQEGEIIIGDGYCCNGLVEVSNIVGITTCEVPSVNIPWDIIFALLAGALVFALLRKKDALIGLISGAIAGVFVYMILSFWLSLDWWQQLALGLGIGVGGAVIIYLFGAGILAFLIIIVELIRK